MCTPSHDNASYIDFDGDNYDHDYHDDDQSHQQQRYKMRTTYCEAKIEIINNAMMASNHFQKPRKHGRMTYDTRGKLMAGMFSHSRIHNGLPHLIHAIALLPNFMIDYWKVVYRCILCNLWFGDGIGGGDDTRRPKILSTRINSKNVFYDILWIGWRNKPIIVILFLFIFRSRFFSFSLFWTRVKHYSHTWYLRYTQKIITVGILSY